MSNPQLEKLASCEGKSPAHRFALEAYFDANCRDCKRRLKLAEAVYDLAVQETREQDARMVEAYAQGAPLETLRQTGKELAAAIRKPAASLQAGVPQSTTEKK